MSDDIYEDIQTWDTLRVRQWAEVVAGVALCACKLCAGVSEPTSLQPRIPAGVSPDDASRMNISGHELLHMQTWELTTALSRQGLPLSAIHRVYGAVENERWCLETVRGVRVCCKVYPSTGR
jgi:hypothetical protein